VSVPVKQLNHTASGCSGKWELERSVRRRTTCKVGMCDDACVLAPANVSSMLGAGDILPDRLSVLNPNVSHSAILLPKNEHNIGGEGTFQKR